MEVSIGLRREVGQLVEVVRTVRNELNPRDPYFLPCRQGERRFFS